MKFTEQKKEGKIELSDKQYDRMVDIFIHTNFNNIFRIGELSKKLNYNASAPQFQRIKTFLIRSNILKYIRSDGTFDLYTLDYDKLGDIIEKTKSFDRYFTFMKQRKKLTFQY